MRIAFLIDVFPAISETFILNQITGLIDRGHEVDIYAHRIDSGEAAHPDVARYGLLERARSPRRAPTRRLARIVYGARLSLEVLAQHPRAIFQILATLRRSLACAGGLLAFAPMRWQHRGRYDIVQCHYGHNGVIADGLRRMGVISGRIVTMFHGYDIRDGIENGWRMYKPLRDSGHPVLSISGYNRKHLESFGFNAEQIIDHPVGIDPRRFVRASGDPAACDSDENVKLITVARLTEIKGVGYAIAALKSVLIDRPDLKIEYVIVGDGPLRPRLERLASESGLGAVIRFIGACAGDQVAEHLHASDLYLLPSVNEALPMVLMEAQAAGLPAIATDVGSVREIVQDTVSGYVVPAEDTQALAGRILDLIEHRELWRPMGLAGQTQIQAKYDINRLNDRLVELYRRLLEDTLG